MIKILWLCNIPVNAIALRLGFDLPTSGGWITSLCNQFASNAEIELHYCFVTKKIVEVINVEINGIFYHAVPTLNDDPSVYDPSLEAHFKNSIHEIKPDLIHIFGTEYPHTLAMVKAFNRPTKTIIYIQGLCSVIAKHYVAGIPSRVQKNTTFRDFIRHDTIIDQKGKFMKRGEFEIEALKMVNHFIGRTTWDKACSSQINPKANYHFCNESLRDAFYEHQWDISHCERHSIFISQCSYPIKGFHFMLEAMGLILQKFPTAHIYTTGKDMMAVGTIRDQLKCSSYQKYLKQLIVKWNLTSHVTFLGKLNEQQMCEQYLKSNVFVSPSAIENSPNSVGEANVLGVPCVASDVGGVTDMMTHKDDGYIYPHDEPNLLAYYVCKIFEDDELASKFSRNSRNHGLITHDREENLKTLINIYHEIGKK